MDSSASVAIECPAGKCDQSNQRVIKEMLFSETDGDFQKFKDLWYDDLNGFLCKRKAVKMVVGVMQTSLLKLHNRRNTLVRFMTHTPENEIELKPCVAYAPTCGDPGHISNGFAEAHCSSHNNANLAVANVEGDGINSMPPLNAAMHSYSQNDGSLWSQDSTVESESALEIGSEPTDEIIDEDEWQRLSDDGSMMKKVLCHGPDPQLCPQKHQEVTVTVLVQSLDETILKESQELRFVVADQEVPHAIDQTVLFMRKNETCKVIAHKMHCNRMDGGSQAELLPDQLLYIIELLDIQEGPYSSSPAISKRLQWTEKKLAFGNVLYCEKNYEKASMAYEKCQLVYFNAIKEDHPSEVRAVLKKMGLRCHSNRAAALMKMLCWKEALTACRMAEMLDSSNPKILYRKGKILGELGDIEEAVTALKKAKSLCGNNNSILLELNKQRNRLKGKGKANKDMCGGEITTKRQNGAIEKPPRVPLWMLPSSLIAIVILALLKVYWNRR